MIRPTTALLFAILIAASSTDLDAQSSQDGFDTMAQPTEDQIECKASRPPKHLAETAYTRNAYRAILRILAAEQWRETGSCDCFFNTIEWDQVVEVSKEYRVSDDEKRPFDTSALRELADRLLAERDAACRS